MLADPPADFKGPMTYEALTKAGVPLFAYGNFITVAINFIILAFIIFMMVKQINRLKKDAPPRPAGGAARRRGAAARDPRRAEEVGRRAARRRPHVAAGVTDRTAAGRLWAHTSARAPGGSRGVSAGERGRAPTPPR